MKAIWKYPLSTTDSETITMQEGAEILCLQTQYGNPCIWALVDPDAPPERRSFVTLGTGHPIRESFGYHLDYVGTYQLDGGSLVFHVFEVVS